MAESRPNPPTVGHCTTARRQVRPVPVIGGLQFSALSAALNGNHTCGMTIGGKAYCWGFNFFAQLGDGTTTNRSTPVAVSGQM